jgi:16S rRNA (adenine1518-N6/adenine1519-N6)-dimethyltransferase
VRLERTGPAPSPELRRLIRGAFAHRRKALPRSLELSGGLAGVGGPDIRPRARAALEAIGHPPDERAERLAPEEFRALLEQLQP